MIGQRWPITGNRHGTWSGFSRPRPFRLRTSPPATDSRQVDCVICPRIPIIPQTNFIHLPNPPPPPTLVTRKPAFPRQKTTSTYRTLAHKMIKRILRLLAILGLLAVLCYIWNNPGNGGQVSHSPHGRISAWLSHRGWAGINGKYTLAFVNDDAASVFQEYSFTCSTPIFAQMRETPDRYLSWNQDGTILTVSIPNEPILTIMINK